jgi:hypothetical protein
MTDSTNADGDRTAQLEQRIADLERRTPRAMMEQGRTGIEEAFWAIVHNAFPGEARRHLKAATREQLLAARIYIDRWIAGLEEGGDEPSPSAPTRQHERIDVE